MQAKQSHLLLVTNLVLNLVLNLLLAVIKLSDMPSGPVAVAYAVCKRERLRLNSGLERSDMDFELGCRATFPPKSMRRSYDVPITDSQSVILAESCACDALLDF
jgi:hypothetical protein